MTKETIIRIKLTAGEGMVLTNGETFGREIFLAAADSPANWQEIPQEVYRDIMEKEAENCE